MLVYKKTNKVQRDLNKRGKKMKFLRQKKELSAGTLNESDFVVLSYEQLLNVNGAGGGSSSGASSSSSSNCGNLTEKGYPSSRDQNQGVSPAGTLAERGYPCSTTGYNPSAPSNKQDAKIYAVDYPSSNDGRPDHFVNDIGNGQYFDPATGKTGYVSDLQLATEGLGGTRELRYHDK